MSSLFNCFKNPKMNTRSDSMQDISMQNIYGDDSSKSVSSDAEISTTSNTIIEMEEESELHKSIRDENIKETEKLLLNNKDFDDVNKENKDGETPFYLAAGSEKGGII